MWPVALVALAILGSFTLLRLGGHSWDPSTFIAAGDGVTDPSVAPPGLDIAEGSLGYDGQLFYRLARNPVTEGRHEFGVEFVRPEYRHQRIGYPLAAWVVSFGGRPALVPWSLILVNLAAGVAISALGSLLARDCGRSRWWGLVVGGWSGFLVAMARDLSEVLAGALLLASILALRRGRSWPAALALTAAALTRETTLVFAAAIVGAHVLARLADRARSVPGADRRPSTPAWVGILPFGAWVAWRVALRQWWGPDANAADAPESFLVVPLTGLTRQLWTWTSDLGPVDSIQLLQLILALGVVGLLVSTLTDRRAGLPHERFALVAAVVLLSSMPVWDRNIVFLRWPNEVVIVGFAIAFASRLDLRRVGTLVGVLWAVTAGVWISVA